MKVLENYRNEIRWPLFNQDWMLNASKASFWVLVAGIVGGVTFATVPETRIEWDILPSTTRFVVEKVNATVDFWDKNLVCRMNPDGSYSVHAEKWTATIINNTGKDEKVEVSIPETTPITTMPSFFPWRLHTLARLWLAPNPKDFCDKFTEFRKNQVLLALPWR